MPYIRRKYPIPGPPTNGFDEGMHLIQNRDQFATPLHQYEFSSQSRCWPSFHTPAHTFPNWKTAFQQPNCIPTEQKMDLQIDPFRFFPNFSSNGQLSMYSTAKTKKGTSK